MLSRNDMLTTGNNRRRRQRGVVRVQEPASGFFIAGSSIEAINGVYVRRSPSRSPPLIVDALTAGGESRIGLLYRHCDSENSGWTLALIKQVVRKGDTGNNDDCSDNGEEDEEDNDELWEWILMDEKCHDRFVHDGDTIIPGAGHERWKAVHGDRQSRLEEREERKQPVMYPWEFGFGRMRGRQKQNSSKSKRDELVKAKEDTWDELPWQVIALLDNEVLNDLYYAYEHRKRRIALSIAGKSAPKPRRGSIEDAWSPGNILYRANQDAKAFIKPDEASFTSTLVKKGCYYAAIEVRDDGWIQIQAAGSDGALMMMHYLGKTPAWVKAGVLDLADPSEKPMDDLEKLETEQGKGVFDQPFVPRIDAASDDSKAADKEEAEKARRFPTLCAKLSFKARDAYERGRFLPAAELYAHAIDEAESKHEKAAALGCRAACYRRARELDKALQDCNDSLALFPLHDEVIFRKAAVLLEMGKPQRAIEIFEDLYRLNRAFPGLLEWLIKAEAMNRRAAKGGIVTDLPTKDDSDIACETDHYKVLGVTIDATAPQLKRAYRLMSLKYHPDRPEGSNAAFQRVNTAFEVLSDEQTRAAYDAGDEFSSKNKDDDCYDSDDDSGESVRDEVTRKYYPEKNKFWPFGDPFIRKRKLEKAKRKRGNPKGAWPAHDVDY